MLPNDPVTRNAVRVITLDNPPVNALSFAYSAKLLDEIAAAEADAAVRAVVITGANGLFSGGADVNDFNSEPTPETKTIRDVIAAIERGEKTYVAAIDGSCLGGAFELALACDYRRGSERAKLGLPEILLGLLPGAGGTQRLPRLIGARAALELMLKGKPVSAQRAVELGILDEIAPGDVVEQAVAFAHRIVNDPLPQAPRKRRVSEREAIIADDLPLQAGPYVVAQAHKMVPPEANGGLAAHKLIDAVQASIELSFPFGSGARGAPLRRAGSFRAVVGVAPSFLCRTRALENPRSPAGRAATGCIGRRRRRGHDGQRNRHRLRTSRHPGRRGRQQRRSR